MSAQDRLRWDQVYRDRDNDPYPPPDPLMFEFTPPLKDTNEHRALDLAAGVGQNGLWLSAQGYIVDLVDISRIALLRGQAEVSKRGLRNVNLLAMDLDSYEPDTNHYELVCVFRYLKRDLFSKLRNAVAPGGRVIYETFNKRYLEIAPGFNTAFLLEIGELSGYFGDWKILHYLEDNHISRLVAVKP